MAGVIGFGMGLFGFAWRYYKRGCVRRWGCGGVLWGFGNCASCVAGGVYLGSVFGGWRVKKRDFVGDFGEMCDFGAVSGCASRVVRG